MTSSEDKFQYHLQSIIRHRVSTSEGPWVLETPLNTRYVDAGSQLVNLIEECNQTLSQEARNSLQSEEYSFSDPCDSAITTRSAATSEQLGMLSRNEPIGSKQALEGKPGNFNNFGDLYKNPRKRFRDEEAVSLDEKRLVIRRDSIGLNEKNSDRPHEFLMPRPPNPVSPRYSSAEMATGLQLRGSEPLNVAKPESFSEAEKQQAVRFIQLGRGAEEVVQNFERFRNDRAHFKQLYNEVRKSDGTGRVRMEFSSAEIQILQDHINKGGNWPGIRDVFPLNQDSYRSKFYSLLKQTRRGR